jgi:hypothetical protein
VELWMRSPTVPASGNVGMREADGVPTKPIFDLAPLAEIFTLYIPDPDSDLCL